MDNVNATPAASDNATPAQGQAQLFEAPAAAEKPNDGAPETTAPESKDPVTPPVTPTKKAYKFKIDDQEVTEELTEEDVTKYLQKAKGADKRFQEAATIKQQTERLYQLLKENPLSVIEKIHGPKSREMMEKHLWQQIERERMDPQARELLETKERLQALEAEKKAFEEKQQQEQFTKLKLQHAQNFDKEIKEALTASGKPVTSYGYKRVAHYMLQAMNEGRQLSAKDAVPLMEADQQADFRAMFETVTEDQIIALLGEPVVEKIRKADLKRVRSGNLPQTPPPAPQKKEEKKPDARDLERRSGSIFDWE